VRRGDTLLPKEGITLLDNPKKGIFAGAEKKKGMVQKGRTHSSHLEEGKGTALDLWEMVKRRQLLGKKSLA